MIAALADRRSRCLHPALLLLAATTGCAASLSTGAQAVATTAGAGSVEATVAAGAGLGDIHAAGQAKLEGSLGAARSGGVQGRFVGGFEYVTLGEQAGWQLGGGIGGSFGAYQSPDLTLQLSGGGHWVVDYRLGQDKLAVTSVALDVLVGYAIRTADRSLSDDGSFFGLGVSFRYDSVTDPKIKYIEPLRRATASR